MLESDEIVSRVIDDILLIEKRADRLVGMQNVALGAPVKQSLLADSVVNPHQPSVFMDGRWGCGREQVRIGVGCSLKSAIWIDEAR